MVYLFQCKIMTCVRIGHGWPVTMILMNLGTISSSVKFTLVEEAASLPHAWCQLSFKIELTFRTFRVSKFSKFTRQLSTPKYWTSKILQYHFKIFGKRTNERSIFWTLKLDFQTLKAFSSWKNYAYGYTFRTWKSREAWVSSQLGSFLKKLHYFFLVIIYDYYSAFSFFFFFFFGGGLYPSFFPLLPWVRHWEVVERFKQCLTWR